MKITAILFIFISYAVVKGMLLEATSEEQTFTFPTLAVPSFEFIDLSGGCAGFTDCIEYVGAVLHNIGLGIIFIVLLLVNLLVYVFELFSLLIEVTFSGIDDAPTWLNILLATPFLASLAFIIYKIVRSGRSEA